MSSHARIHSFGRSFLPKRLPAPSQARELVTVRSLLLPSYRVQGAECKYRSREMIRGMPPGHVVGVKPCGRTFLVASLHGAPCKCRCLICLGIAKFHRPGGGGAEAPKMLCHGSRGWKSKIRVLAGLVSSEASLLASKMAVLSLCLLHVAVPRYVCWFGVRTSPL